MNASEQHLFENEILLGLRKANKSISPKFLYDERGSQIFEKICELPEYYPTRSEIEILRMHAKEMASFIGPNAILIEPGCGNCEKVRYLLSELLDPVAYVALDISEDFLMKTARNIQYLYPRVPVYPVVADYTQAFSIPSEISASRQKRVIFFPGSTIGNLDPQEAKDLLERMARLIRVGGGLLIGVDQKKDAKILELAYDDPQGVTAEFNYNLLDRLNREFAGDFDRNNFTYEAFYNSDKGRVEMGLVSRIPQEVHMAGNTIHLNESERIHTEDSYKYSTEEFIELGESAGFQFKTSWTDPHARFRVYYFERGQAQ